VYNSFTSTQVNNIIASGSCKVTTTVFAKGNLYNSVTTKVTSCYFQIKCNLGVQQSETTRVNYICYQCETF